MKKPGLLLILIFIFFGVHAKESHAQTRVTFLGKSLGIDGQAGWEYFLDGDAPSGGYAAHVDNLGASINLGQNLAPGTYYLFIKLEDYDYPVNISASLGGATASRLSNKRDADRLWNGPIQLNMTSASQQLQLQFSRAVPTGRYTAMVFQSLYLTTVRDEVVLKNDYVIKLRPPTPDEYDNSPPVKGNLLSNSSFEAGVNQGWGFDSTGNRTFTVDSVGLWAPGISYHGTSSLHLPAAPAPGAYLVSRALHLKPNKKYTLSAWVKSTDSNWVGLMMVNAFDPPWDFTGYQELPEFKAGALATPTWQRISITGYLLAYPSSDYHIVLTSQAYAGGEIYLDALELEEGDLTDYAPAHALSLSVVTTADGRLYFEDETAGPLIRVANTGGSPATAQVHYEVFNIWNERVVGDSTLNLTVPAGGTQETPLPFPEKKLRGIFRANAWIAGVQGSEDELVFSVLPRPQIAGADATSNIGIHPNGMTYQFNRMQKLGMKWARGLSPGSYFRWSIAEPVEGQMNWRDGEVDAHRDAGIALMGNIGEAVPPWAVRMYFTLSGISGTFQVGETVSSSTGAQGRITLVLTSANTTGPALQLTNVSGTFAKDQHLTGSSSGASATISSRPFPNSRALDKWEAYVDKTATHYRGRVPVWEIDNEPNQHQEEVPYDPDNPAVGAGFYAEELRRAARKIRTIDPGAQIVAMGGVFSEGFIIDVLTRLGSEWPSLMDAISLHFYPGNEEVAKRTIEGVKARFPTFDKPVWNTETGVVDLGFYTGVNASFRNSGFSLDPFVDASRFYAGHAYGVELMTKNFFGSMGNGISKYFYYDSRLEVSPAYYNIHYTILDFDDGIRAKGIGYGIAARFFDHAIGRGSLLPWESNNRAYLFDRQGTPVVALYSIDNKPRTLNLSSLGSIKVYDCMGNPLSISAGAVPFGRSPIYLEGIGMPVATMESIIRGGSIVERSDTEPPNLAITYGPRGPVRYGDNLHLRWLAMDKVSIPDLGASQSILYSWMLEGQDSTWSTWSGKIFADYSTLAPGNYTFRVKSKDAAGNLSAIANRSIVIINSDGGGKPAPPRSLRLLP